MNSTRVGLAVVITLFAALVAGAHETDQFTVPPNRKFADLGDYFDRWAYRAIEQGVGISNAQIRQAIALHRPSGVLAELQSGPHVTMAVRTQWPASVSEIDNFEKLLGSPQMRRRYPGRVVAYGERFAGVYDGAFSPLDIRELAHMLFFSSTIKVHGTYLGTDKIGHFTDIGISYYFEYLKARDSGLGEKQAVARAVRLGIDGPNSESGMLGTVGNSDYANGDVAANFAGFLFYRNLTGSVALKGQICRPMLVREGPYWKIADEIRPNSRFFARFISDHLDEALNPGYFDEYLRPAMRKAVRARTEVLLQHYCDKDGQPRPREWFDAKLNELSSYWGVDYGHRGTYDELVSIGGSCFDGPADTPPGRSDQLAQLARAPRLLSAMPTQTPPTHARPKSPAVPSAQSTPQLAAAQRHGVASANFIFVEAKADTRDEFGRTPLHEAGRAGSEQATRQLLQAGANPRATDDYGSTPLHLACRRGSIETARLLLEHGADVNAPSAAGATPLHEAASSGDGTLIRLLLDHGANPNVRDDRGRTPRSIAIAGGFLEVAALLQSGDTR
jgi:hypothetical protein